jgi:hypothetical protein
LGQSQKKERKMLFRRINRSNPEKIFIVVMNSYSTASLTNGQAVMWDATTDADGVSVTKPAAVTGVSIAGVAAETIAHNAYGLVQCWGYHSAVIVRTLTGGAPAGAAHVPICGIGANLFLETMDTASDIVISFPCGFLLAAQASYTTKAVAAFIKAL